MRWLLFLSRVAFLCGLLMLLAHALLFTPWSKDEGLGSTIVMGGYGLATVMLPLTGLMYLILRLSGKKPAEFIPAWLIICNLTMLLILLIFTFYINDPYYHHR